MLMMIGYLFIGVGVGLICAFGIVSIIAFNSYYMMSSAAFPLLIAAIVCIVLGIIPLLFDFSRYKKIRTAYSKAVKECPKCGTNLMPKCTICPCCKTDVTPTTPYVSSRTVLIVPTSKSFEDANAIISNILMKDGFIFEEESGEKYWRKGIGFLTAIQCVKVEYAEDSIALMGWIHVGVSKLRAPENDLSGTLAFVIKDKDMKRLLQIKSLLEA